MKINTTNEALENIIKVKDSTAAMDPAMELAKETANDKEEEFVAEYKNAAVQNYHKHLFLSE